MPSMLVYVYITFAFTGLQHRHVDFAVQPKSGTLIEIMADGT